MVEIFSISSALTTTGNITMLLMVAAILIAAFIGIYEYKGELLEYITNRRNKWWFAVSALFFAVLVFLWTGKKLPDDYMFVLAFAYVVFVIDCFYSLQPRFFSDFQNPVLRYYEKSCCYSSKFLSDWTNRPGSDSQASLSLLTGICIIEKSKEREYV